MVTITQNFVCLLKNYYFFPLCKATIAAFAASEGHAHPRVVELPKVSKQVLIRELSYRDL